MSRDKIEVKNNANFVHRTLNDASISVPVESHVFWVKFVKQNNPVNFKSGENWVYDFANMRRYSCAGAWQFEDIKYLESFGNKNEVSVEKINRDRIILHNPTERDIRLILKRVESQPPRGGAYRSPGSVTRNNDGSYTITGQNGEPITIDGILLVPTVVGNWTVKVEATLTAIFDSHYCPFQNLVGHVYYSGVAATNASGTQSVFKKTLFHVTNGGTIHFKEAERLASLISYKPVITGGMFFFGVDTPYTPIHGGGGSWHYTSIHAFEGGMWTGKGRKISHFQYVDGKWTSFPDDPPVGQGSISAELDRLTISPDPGYLPFDIYYIIDPNGDRNYNKNPYSNDYTQPTHSQAGEPLPPKKDKIKDVQNSTYLAEIYFDNQLIYTTTADELLCTFPIDLIKEGGTIGQIPDNWVHPLDTILNDENFNKWSEKIGSNWGLFPGNMDEIVITNRGKYDFDYTKAEAERLEPLMPNSLNLYGNTKAYSIARNHHLFLLLEGATQKTLLDTVGSNFYINRNCKGNYCCFQFIRLVVIEIKNGAINKSIYPIDDGKIKGLPKWIRELDFDGFLNPFFHFATKSSLSKRDENENPGGYGLNTQGIHQLSTTGISPTLVGRELPIPFKTNNFTSRKANQRYSKFYFGIASYKPVRLTNSNNPGYAPFAYGFPFKTWFQSEDTYWYGTGIGEGIGVVTDDVCRYYNNINYVDKTVYTAHIVAVSKDKIVNDTIDIKSSFNVVDHEKRCGELIGTKLFRDALKNGNASVKFKLIDVEKNQPDAVSEIYYLNTSFTTFNINTTNQGLKALIPGLEKAYSPIGNIFQGVKTFSVFLFQNFIGTVNAGTRSFYPYIKDYEKVFNIAPNTKMQLSSVVKYPKINLTDKSLIYFLTAIRTDKDDELERKDVVNPFSLTLEERLQLRN